MAEKIIIDNQTRLSLESALKYVSAVIKLGKVSTGRYGEQYCFHVAWPDGISIDVISNKKSQRFVIYKG